MGQDKAQLVFQNQTLLDRSLNLLRSSGSSRILLSGLTSTKRNTVSEAVPDILPSCGPPGGLFACLEFLYKEGSLTGMPLLVLPIDMPLLNEEVLHTLLDAVEGKKACHIEDEVMPCVLRAELSLRNHLHEIFNESLALGGKRSMRNILKFCNSFQLAKKADWKDLFQNLNSPEDYEMLLKTASD